MTVGLLKILVFSKKPALISGYGEMCSINTVSRYPAAGHCFAKNIYPAVPRGYAPVCALCYSLALNTRPAESRPI